MASGPRGTAETARQHLEQIRALAHDDEEAHFEEKRLWEHALIAIAEGYPDAKEIAEIALETRGIDFCRWYP